MARRRGQDDLARRARLNEGCCPTHGIPLVQIGVDWQEGRAVGDLVSCPRGDCTFIATAKPRSKLWNALRDMEEKQAGGTSGT